MCNEESAAVASCVVVDDACRVPHALEALARRYHSELLCVLRARLANEQDAADLAQEAYVRLFRYQGEYTGEELRRMLFQIARNLLTDHWRWRRLRSGSTHLPIDELDREIDSGEPTQDRQLDGERWIARLEEVVLAMPEKRRAVFILSRINGLTNAEVAERCGISIKTVEKHLALALAECRAEIGQDALESL